MIVKIILKLVISGVHGDIKSTFSSCNTGMSGMLDIYTQSLRAIGLRAEGGHTYQAGHKYLCYSLYVTLS